MNSQYPQVHQFYVQARHLIIETWQIKDVVPGNRNYNCNINGRYIMSTKYYRYFPPLSVFLCVPLTFPLKFSNMNFKISIVVQV